MFTGIIEDQGVIKRIHYKGSSAQMTIQSHFSPDEIHLGDSIAVDGVCLTITDYSEHGFSVDISQESLQRTTLGLKRESGIVNLERALRLSDRIGGHLVSGHVDGMATVTSIVNRGDAVEFSFSAPENILKYIIEKGSVAVDGISLTVNNCTSGGFSLMIIPFTLSHTTMGNKKVGNKVNVENDMIGKYVEKFLLKLNKTHGITAEFLEKFNFR